MVVLSPFQSEKRNELHAFAEEKINVGTKQRDHLKAFDRELWKACGNIGLHKINIPKVQGGDENNTLDTISIFESMGYSFNDNGLSFGICAQLMSVSTVLSKYAKQPSKLLEPIIEGKQIAAHAITEKKSGSDAFNLESRYIVEDTNYFKIKGSKTYCSNLMVSDYVLCYLNSEKDPQTSSCFYIPIEKLDSINLIEKMGLNTCHMGEFQMDCTLDSKYLIGKEGQGKAIFNESIALERIGMSAMHLGTIERILQQVIQWVKNRKVGADLLSSKQAITHPITDLYERWMILRTYLYSVINSNLSFQKMYLQASIIKDQVSQLYVDCSTQALQSYGALGYTKEIEIERMVRDAMASRIYSGTSEVHREIVWRLIH